MYLTPIELGGLLTGVNWSALFGTTNGQPTVGQLQLCKQVSDEIDRICGQNVFGPARPYALAASVDTETYVTTAARDRVLIDASGNLSFRVAYRPIVTVVAGSWLPLVGSGMTGGTPNAFDLANVEWQDREVTYYGYFQSYAWEPLRVSLTYVNGYANALLTANAAAGAVSLAVDDLTGFVPGQLVSVFDAGSVPPEDVQVATSFVGPTTPGPNPGTLPLVSGTAYAHASGVRVSAMPASLQQAAVWVALDLIQHRSVAGMKTAQAASGAKTAGAQFDYYAAAQEILESFTLVW